MSHRRRGPGPVACARRDEARRLRAGAAAALVALALGVALPAAAVVTGTPPTLFRQFTVQGSASSIGNTLMSYQSDPRVNEILLPPTYTGATLTGVPLNAHIEGAYVFYSGRLDTMVDNTFDFYTPDGRLLHLTADMCRTLSSDQETFFYCRKDVTSYVRGVAPAQAGDSNGVYNVNGVDAKVGQTGSLSNGCSSLDPGCQAAYAGWSMVVVWSSPSYNHVRNLNIYDGFYACDEDATTSGISPPIPLSGFEVGNPAVGELTFFGLEGDPQLGSPPLGPEWADFMRFIAQDGTQNKLQSIPSNPPDNLFNSTIPNAAVPFNGVDIDTFELGPSGLNLIKPGQTSAEIQPGSGDGIVDGLGQGEFFALGYVLLAIDTVSPQFGGQTGKVVDKTSAAAGETLTYTVSVENTGSEAATNVVLKDAIPAGTTYLAGSTALDGTAVADQGGQSVLVGGLSLGTVDYRPGTTTSHTVTFQVRINGNVADGTQVCNTATVDSDQTQPKPLTTSPCTTVSAPNLHNPPTLTVTDLNGGKIIPGDTLRYDVHITNDGSQPARQISYQSDLPGYVKSLSVVVVPSGSVDGSTGTGGANGTGRISVTGITVPGNFSVDIVYEVTIDTVAELLAAGVPNNGIDGLKLSTQGTLTAPYLSNPYLTDDPSTVPTPDPTVATIDYGVNLSSSAKQGVDVNGGLLVPGDTVRYTIIVKNTRNRDATVHVVDDIPAPVNACTVVSAPAGTTCSGTGGTFGSGQLVTPPFTVAAGGGQVVITFTVVVKTSAADGATVQNSAVLTADEMKGSVTVTSSPLTVTNRPDLSQTTKSVTDLNGGNVVPGDTLQYTIVVRNDGNQAATNVVVVDPVPAQLTSVRPGQGGNLSGGRIQWTSATTPVLASIGPAGQASLTFTAVVVKPLANGTVIANQASVACDQLQTQTLTDDPSTPAVDDPTRVTVVSAPVLVNTTKTATDVNGGQLRPGDTVHWTITVRNTGSAVATGVVVTDPLDPNLVNVVPGNGGTLTGSTLTWNLGTVGLSPGGDTTVTFDADVRSPLPNGTVISNQAFVAASQIVGTVPSDDPSTPAAGDPTRITVTSQADLSGTTKTWTDLNGGAQMPGDVLEYRITLTNSGDAPARNVTVSDPIASCLTGVQPQNGGAYAGGTITWTGGGTPALVSVVPGTPVTLVFRATITPGTPNGTACANQGTASSADLAAPVLTDDPSTPAVDDPTVVNVVSRPVLDTSTKTVTLVADRNGDGQFSPGDRIDYTLVVKNTGTQPATSVTVSDPLSILLTNVSPSAGGTVSGGAVVWNLGTLATGASTTLHIQADIVTPLDNGTVLSNQGHITFAQSPTEVLTDDPSTPAPHDPTTVTLHSAPDLSTTTKDVTDPNGPPVRPNDVLDYTITVRNTGTEVAHTAYVTDVLDPNVTFVSAGSGGTYDAATRTVRWDLGDVLLAPAGARALPLSVRVLTPLDNGTVISNQAFVHATNLATPTPSDDPRTTQPADPTKVTVVSGADLTASTKTVVDVNGGQVRPGDALTWTVTVTNVGDAIARNVQVADAIPANLSSVTVGQGGTISAGIVHWSSSTTPALAAVAPGDVVTLTLSSQVAKPLDDGTVIANQAQITAQGLAAPVPTDDPSTPALDDPTQVVVHSAPDLSTSTKTFTDANGGQVRPGDTITWTLTLKNTGDMVARSLTVTDVLDPNLGFVSATAGGSFDAATRTITWPVASVGLSPAGDVTLRVTTKVAFPLDDGTTIANQGTITGASLPAAVATDDPATPAPNDPTVITVHSAPDLSGATKTVTDPNGGDVAPGDVLDYTITVPNAGDMVAHGVTVTDVIDPNLDQVTPADGGTFDAASRTIRWPAADIAPGTTAERVLHFTARVKPLLAGGTRIPNQAMVHLGSTTVPTDDPSTPAPSDPTTVTVVAAPVLSTSTKTVTDVNGGLVAPGDTLRYQITVRDTGNTYANHVRVVDPISPSLTNVVPGQGGVVSGGNVVWDETTTPALLRVSPEAGGEVVLTFTARIRAVVPDGTTISNQGHITCAELPTPAVTDDPSTPAPGDPTIIVVSIPDLTTSTKTVTDVNGGAVEPGDTLRWTIHVVNSGSHAATGVVVTDPVDSTNLVGIAPTAGGTYSGGTITWQLGTVAAGTDATLGFTAKVAPLLSNGTVISNQARIAAAELNAPVLTDDPSTPAPADPTKVTVTSAPAFDTATKAVQDVNGGDVVPGDALHYTITFENTGNTYATDAVVDDPIDPNLQNVTFSPQPTMSGTTAQWTSTEIPALARLAPGQKITITADATVKRPLANGTLVSNQVQIRCAERSDPPFLTDDPATPAVGDPTTVKVLSAPRLSHSEKTVTDLNGGDVEPGDVLEYQVVVVNDGTEDATGVTVTDAVPPMTHYVPGTTTMNGLAVADGPGGTSLLATGLVVHSARAGTPKGVVLADDKKKPDDELVLLTWQVQVDPGTAGGTVISNQASIVADGLAPARTDDPSTPTFGDPTVVVVGRSIVLDGAFKTWRLVEDHQTPGVVEPGDVVAYDITLTNRGTVDATGVDFTDAIPTGTAYVAGTLTLDGQPLTDAADGDPGQVDASGVKIVVPRIAARGQVTISFQMKIQDGAPPTVVNQADVRAVGPDGTAIAVKTDADPTTPGAQPTVIPVGPTPVHDLSTSVKSVEDLNGGRVREGDLLRYTVTVRNTGNVPATSVTVTDDVPKWTSFDSAQAPDGVTVATTPPPAGKNERGQVTFTVTGPVAAGASLSIPFLVRVDKQVPDGALVENVASVTADSIDPFDLPPVRLVVGASPGTGGYAGKVFQDMGVRDGKFEAGTDVALPGFTIVAHRASDPTGPQVASAVSDPRGDYTVLGLPPGVYVLDFISPTGVQFASVTAPSVTGDAVVVQDGLIDPSGVVYRADSGDGVAGAKVYLLYDDSMVGQPPLPCDSNQTPIDLVEDPTIGASPTNPLPRPVGAGCLAPGQQGQVTAAGAAAGLYRFDVPPSSPAMAYRMVVISPAPQLAFPSVTFPPQPGFAPAGPVVPEARPNPKKDTTYYLRFKIGDAADEVTNDHVPLDVVRDLVSVTKVAGRATASIGDLVPYTITVTNRSGEDLDVASGGIFGGVTVQDLIPEGFRFVPGTTVASRVVPVPGGEQRLCPRLDQEAQATCPSQHGGPVRSAQGTNGPAVGRVLSFGPYDLPAGQRLEVHYTLAVVADATQGEKVNRATATYDDVELGKASAAVRVAPDPLFDEGTVFGKVFCDENGDGRQEPGDEGLPGVRVYADIGHYADTDVAGKYHLQRLPAGMRVFKVDPGTLPPGSRPEGFAAKPYYLTPGLDTVLDFPVLCGLTKVTPTKVQVMAPMAPPTVEIHGSIPTLAASVGSADVGRLAVEVQPRPGPGATKTAAVMPDLPPGPVVLATKAHAKVRSWQIVVVRVPNHGAVDPTHWPVVRTFEGEGAPPASLTWRPHNGVKGVFATWLFVEASGARAARSPIRIFGVGRHPPPSKPVDLTIEGPSFPPRGTQPTSLLKKRLRPVIEMLRRRADATARLEVHVDTRYGARAQQLTDKRAERVKRWLVSQGIDARRIVAIGRGSSDPLVPNISRRNRERNRRVHVVAWVPDDTPPLPTLIVDRRVSVSGTTAVSPDAAGHFDVHLAMPKSGKIVVGLERHDGATFGAAVALDDAGKLARKVTAVDGNGKPKKVGLDAVAGYGSAAAKAAGGRVASHAAAAPVAAADPPPKADPVTVSVTVPRRGVPTAHVGKTTHPLPLLDLVVRARRTRVHLGRGRRFRPSLRFYTRVPRHLPVATWALVLEDVGGAELARVTGKGRVPRTIRWNGTGAGGKPVLHTGDGVRYLLEVTSTAGDKGGSAEGRLVVVGPSRSHTLRGLFVGNRIPPMRRLKLAPIAAEAKSFGGRVHVAVHTDSTGGTKAAKARTVAQAKQLVAALVAMGVPARRIGAVGEGDSQPLVPNLTQRNRDKNKRVVIVVTSPSAGMPAPAKVSPLMTVAGAKATRSGRTFTATVPLFGPKVTVEVTAEDGRWARYHLPVPVAPKVASAGTPAGTGPTAAGPSPGGTTLGGGPAEVGPSHGGTTLGAGEGPAPGGTTLGAGEGPSPGGTALGSARGPSPGGTALGAGEGPSHGGTTLGAGEGPSPSGTKLGAAPPAKETLSRKAPAPPKMHLVTRDLADVDTKAVPVASTRVRLPADGATVNGDHLAILGRTAPGCKVTVNGKPLEVQRGGRFVGTVTLPRGPSSIVVKATDPNGDEVTFERKIVSAPDGFFLMAMADTAAGRSGDELAGVTDATRLTLGPVYLSGRAVVYGKGQWHGSYGPWQDLKLTVHLDSGRTRQQTYFEDLVQPDKGYAIYGDSGSEVQDVSAAGPVYLSLSADKSKLVVGDFRTRIGTGGLFDYVRTFYGGQLHLDQTLFGSLRSRADAFVSDGDIGLRQGHVVMQGTGGSLYFLRDRDVVEGSERLAIVVRDRDTGVVLSTRYLVRNVDYTIRYAEGQVVLQAPLPSVVTAGWLGGLNLVSTLDGNPVFLVADYSYQAMPDSSRVAGGGYLKETFAKLVTVGGGILAQGNGAGADPYELWGLSLELRPKPHSYLTAEYAHSAGTDTEGFYSANGGLDYSTLTPDCTGTVMLSPACKGGGNALKLEGAISLGDLLGKKKDIVLLSAHLELQDAGFYSSAHLLDQGQSRGGAILSWRPSKQDEVSARIDQVDSQVPTGAQSSGTTDLERIDRTFFGLRYKHTGKRWRATGEWSGVMVSDPTNGKLTTHIVALGGQYDLTKRVTLLLEQDLVLGGDPRYVKSFGDRMTTTLGGRYHLTKALDLDLGAQLRWNGENSAILGIRAKTGEGSHVYANERLSLEPGGGFVSTSVLGADQKIAGGVRAFGEYQLDGAMNGQYGRAVLGVSDKWEPFKDIKLGLNLERVQVLGDPGAVTTGTGTGVPGTVIDPTTGRVSTSGRVDGLPPTASPGANPAGSFYPGTVSRNAASGSFEVLKKALKASLRLEGRFDEADPNLAGSQPGVASRLQGVALGNVAWRWTHDLSLIGRLNWSATQNLTTKKNEALWLESTAGVAFRPESYDFVNVLFKYTYLIDQRPIDLVKGTADRQASHVLSLAPSVQTPWHLGLSEKLAYKLTTMDTGLGEPAALRPATGLAHTILWINRLDLHLTDHIDLSGEYRMLWVLVGSSSTSQLSGTLRQGFVAEAAWRVSKWVRLGAGWNFAGFSDDVLSRFDHTESGPFIRVTGLY